MNQMNDTGEEFVLNYLAHYASKYYDPAKAREYYLRNRELKGRRSTKGITGTQKQARYYAKNQISEEKKTNLKGNATNRKTEMTGLRKEAAFKRKLLAEKIKALPKIPKGLSKETRAKAALERKKEIAKIRGEAFAVKKGERENGAQSRKKVAEDLKGVLNKAKVKYDTLKTQIIDDYEAKYQSEYEAIKSSV